MVAADLHPAVEVLAPLLGSWSGHGDGEYPTITPFAYEETVTFAHTGKPFLVYTQRTQAADDGRALHGESGYLRVGRRSWAELVVAQPTGIVEIDEGPVDGSTLVLRSILVGCTSTAVDVTAVERELVVEGDTLRTTLRMAAVGQPMTHHLASVLRRI